jgi:hypothetical protein
MLKISAVFENFSKFLQRLAAFNTFIDLVAKELKDYLYIAFREEILEEINLKALLSSLVKDLDEEEARKVLEEASFYIMTGKSLDPKYLMEEKQEEEKKRLEGVPATQHMWEEGKGHMIEAALDAELRRILLKAGVEPENLKVTMDKMLLRSTGSLKPEDAKIFNKVKPDIIKYLSNTIRLIALKRRKKVLDILNEQAPVEVLEPSVKDWERGVTKENVDPAWKKPGGLDIEEISKFVEKHFDKAHELVYYNIISKKPISETQLISEIDKETGKKLSQPSIHRMKAEVLDKLYGEFFPGIPREKKVNINQMSFEDMAPSDREEFEKYVEKELKDKGTDEELIKKVMLFLKELGSGKTLKEISEKIGIPLESIKKYTQRYVKNYYEDWIKERTEKTASFMSVEMFNLRWAMMVHKGYSDPELLGSVVHRVMTGASDEDALEQGLDELAQKHLDAKKEVRDKLQKMVERKILNKKDFDILITFKSKFDWNDVSSGKFHPEYDEDEGFVKDDPEFAWESYNTEFVKTFNFGKTSTTIHFAFKQKLLDNGVHDGAPVSSLVVEKNDKKIIDEHGDSFFKAFLDDYFKKIMDLGIPPIKGQDLSVHYRNTRLDRDYANTHVFDDKMGGFAVSDPKHRQKAEEYKEFVRKRKDHMHGPSIPSIKTFTPEKLIRFLKNSQKDSHVSESEKKKIDEYLKELKEGKVPDEKLTEIDKFLIGLDKKERDLHKDVDIFNLDK